MKKLFIFFCLALILAPLFATQRFVVGEVFTQTWCTYCPHARRALLEMAENEDLFPYLVPLVWQGDGPNPSPGYSPRGGGGYGFTGIPAGVWNGQTNASGGSWPGTYNAYVTQYNNYANIASPMTVDISFSIVGNNMTATANVEMLSNITTTQNRIYFIVTHDFPNQGGTGYYYNSVIRYQEQNFNLTTAGESETFTQDIDLPTYLDPELAHLVVIVQSWAGPAYNRQVHQAARKNLNQFPAPTNLVSYSSPNQVNLFWGEPDTVFPVFGYKVSRNGTFLTEAEITETYYQDDTITPGEVYQYYIIAYFDIDEQIVESGPSNPVTIEPEIDHYHLGSGSRIHGPTEAGPVNINFRSTRGQFIYTADELQAAGLEGDAIHKIAFYIDEAPTRVLPNYHLRIAHTNLSNLSAHIEADWESITWIPSFQPADGNWINIFLTEPFQWDGVSNVVFDTAFDMVATNNASGTVRTIFAENGYRYIQSNLGSQLANPTTDLAHYKPQLRLNIAPSNPDLGPPVNLTHTLMTAPVLACRLVWQAPTFEETYFINYTVFRNDEELITLTNLNHIDTTISSNVAQYVYYIVANYTSGVSIPSNTITIEFVPDVDFTDIPIVTKLDSNYPNPFNPSTTIYFDLHQNTFTTLEVYNIKGQLVNTLVDSRLEAGKHSVIWDGTDLNGSSVSGGIYLYRLTTETYKETKRMVMIK